MRVDVQRGSWGPSFGLVQVMTSFLIRKGPLNLSQAGNLQRQHQHHDSFQAELCSLHQTCIWKRRDHNQTFVSCHAEYSSEHSKKSNLVFRLVWCLAVFCFVATIAVVYCAKACASASTAVAEAYAELGWLFWLLLLDILCVAAACVVSCQMLLQAIVAHAKSGVPAARASVLT